MRSKILRPICAREARIGAILGLALALLGPAWSEPPGTAAQHTPPSQTTVPPEVAPAAPSPEAFFATSPPRGAAFFSGLLVTPVAARPGDLLTVLVSESTQATHQAAQEHAKSADTSAGPGRGELSFIPLLGYGGESQSRAQAGATRRQTLYTRITARVVEVLPSGNLLIAGEREITVNRDVQKLTLTGEVRPWDVAADNTILSREVLDLQIHYAGSDPGRPGGRVGILTRLLNLLF